MKTSLDGISRKLRLSLLVCGLTVGGLAPLTVSAEPDPEVEEEALPETETTEKEVSPETTEPETSEEETTEPAKLKVRGFGFLGNRTLTRTLEIVTDTGGSPEFLNANQIEDGAMILGAQMQQEGFLKPTVKAELLLENGEGKDYEWDESFSTLLSRPIRAVKVEYLVVPGLRYFYEKLEFEGLTVLDEEKAQTYFIATGFLFQTRKSLVFTPAGLEQGLANLREVLVRDGYERAQVIAKQAKRNPKNGEVEVVVEVREGSRSLIREVQTYLELDGEKSEVEVENLEDQAYSKVWTQDYAQTLRRDFYRRGFPDAEVAVEVTNRETSEEITNVDLAFTVKPGPLVNVGEVEFRGEEKTQESILRRRVNLKSGDPLDRIEVDSGRTRLARLGIFDWVDTEFETVDEDTRNVIYNLREGKVIDINLLFGYGSYEMFRAGVEVEQFNIFGRGHRSRFLLTQSMRSTTADYRYTVPEIFGEDVHGYGQLFGLQREERDFDRQEFGGAIGAQTLLEWIDTEASLRYTYQLLQTQKHNLIATDGLNRAIVAAVGLDLQRDRRDNPIYPEKGSAIFSRFEVASGTLGGEVDYQRIEVGGSYHHPLRRGRFIHIGLQHGAIHTFGEVAQEIPFNRRFFMGGESTMRGYLQGEASPRNQLGEISGAESFVLLNLEFEQALTQQWAAVLFSDSIGFARNLNHYPFDETLFSVGVGIRYKTFIGPIRLEYGYNLNPRSEDPQGALHLSIGFPF